MNMTIRWSRVAMAAGLAVSAFWAYAIGGTYLDASSIDEGERCSVWTETDPSPFVSSLDGVPGYWDGTYTVDAVLPDGRLRVSRAPGIVRVVTARQVAMIDRL